MTSPSKRAAERFCELLAESGDKSGSKLSKELGIPRPTMFRYRRRINSVDTLGMLADHFNVSIQEFFTGENE